MPTCLPSNTYAGAVQGLYLPKNGDLTVNGTLRIDGNPTAGTSLRVIGATRLQGNVDVIGAINVDNTVVGEFFVGPGDTPAVMPRGAVGFLNGPMPLPSGALCPILVNPVQLTGDGFQIPYPLQLEDMGTYLALSTVNGSTGPFIINFSIGTFPVGGTFFIKNVDKDNSIDIYFNGVSIGATNSPNSSLLPTNSTAGNNGFLCIARYQDNTLKVY